MTEQEAIRIIKEYRGLFPCANNEDESLDEAIKALEEIKQYHAIGTPEECRAAVEKQKSKIADISGDGYADGHMVYDTYECPNCGEQYEIDYDDYEYCPKCGQHMLIDLEVGE